MDLISIFCQAVILHFVILVRKLQQKVDRQFPLPRELPCLNQLLLNQKVLTGQDCLVDPHRFEFEGP